jgi:PAS domain S-box-containing protein
VAGVIEVYQQYAYVQAEVNHLFRTLAIAFGTGLVALYLVLLPIVVRTARGLRDRNERLSRQADQLRETEAKYRDLVERLPAIVYAADFDPAGTWLYVSPQIEHILGFTPEEWTEDPTLFDVRIHPEDEPAYRAAEARDKESGGPFRTEYRMFAKDGREVWLRDEAFVVTGRDGRRFLQGIMFDVTELKRAEEALRVGLEREQEASERLRALDQMRNSFLQAVSHELRTPLTSVLGFALTLRRPELELSRSERDEMLDRLVSNARKLERLLSDLLDVDRLARGVIEPKLHPLDVGELARRVAEETDVGPRRLLVDAPDVIVNADGAKVERIVENLLVNAARHTREDARIWIRVWLQDAGVVICVEDDGSGVPDELKDAIFEPFRQGPPVDGSRSGTGIGLSLVASFAALHGGRVWVEDREGGGASFRVFLPLVPPSPSNGSTNGSPAMRPLSPELERSTG